MGVERGEGRGEGERVYSRLVVVAVGPKKLFHACAPPVRAARDRWVLGGWERSSAPCDPPL